MHQITRFFYLGMLTTAIDYLLYALLLQLGVDYVVAIVIGYAAGLLSSYQIGRRHVFTAGRKVESSRAEFIRIVLIALGGVLLNIVIVKTLSYGWWQIDPLIARVIAIGVTFVWNFVLRKLFVYR